MGVESLSDEELMGRVADLAADPHEESGMAERLFKELYRRYQKQAYSFCRYYGLRHNDAVETIQEAFVRIFKYASSFQKGKRFKSWFFKALFNKVQDKFNELKRAGTDNIDDHADYLGAESEEINLLQNREMLAGIINRLPNHLKQIILLYTYQEMDFEAIAQITGVSERTARYRLDEALQEMKRLAGVSHG